MVDSDGLRGKHTSSKMGRQCRACRDMVDQGRIVARGAGGQHMVSTAAAWG